MISCDQCGKAILEGEYVEVENKKLPSKNMDGAATFDIFSYPMPKLGGHYCSELCAMTRAIAVNLVYFHTDRVHELVDQARNNPRLKFDPLSILRPSEYKQRQEDAKKAEEMKNGQQ